MGQRVVGGKPPSHWPFIGVLLTGVGLGLLILWINWPRK